MVTPDSLSESQTQPHYLWVYWSTRKPYLCLDLFTVPGPDDQQHLLNNLHWSTETRPQDCWDAQEIEVLADQPDSLNLSPHVVWKLAPVSACSGLYTMVQASKQACSNFVGFNSTTLTTLTLININQKFWPNQLRTTLCMLPGSLSFHGNSLTVECHPISTLSDCISRGIWSSPASEHCPEIFFQRSP